MPQSLAFEQFIYLYTALDGCYKVLTSINGNPPRKLKHSERIDYLCKAFNRSTPRWADVTTGTVATYRNDTLHEGLFLAEPLGFCTFGGTSTPPAFDRNILLEMQCLVSRFICGIAEFHDPLYIASDVDTRQRFGVQL
jgi:hypothetical protein